MAQDALKYKVAVLGGSAGSLGVIIRIVEALPADSGVMVIVVVHRKSDAGSILESLLAAKTTMKVKEVEDKEPITANSVFIAPPDYHLLIEDEYNFALDGSEKLHFSRPSIDATFESVANVFGSYTLGILLSGANADGAEGLATIQHAGGYTIVQDPATAEVSYMPQQALNLMQPDAVVTAAQLPEFVSGLLRQNNNRGAQ
jgi:two-component system chemotaxis response regulator CheB